MIRSGWTEASRPSRRPLRGLLRMTNFFNAIHSARHAEECPEGASRSTHNGDAELSTVRRLSPALILLLVVLALAGCGKKGNPQAPPGEPDTYPRTYPSG
jgi:hypothetical protein